MNGGKDSLFALPIPLKNRLRAFTACGLVGLLSFEGWAQGTFRNLGFEEANLPYLPPGQVGGRVSASDALPGWTVYGGYTSPDVLHNNEALDSASISILSSNYVSFPGLVTGTYYVHLRSDSLNPSLTASIGQTGQIPSWAATLLVDAAYVFPPAVHVGGVYAPLAKLSPKGDYAFVYGRDISSFAGQTVELRFYGSWFDNIRFSAEPIPEPSAITMVVVGLGLIYRRAQKSGR